MSKSKLKTFNVQFETKITSSVEVKAESLEQALNIARDFGVEELVEVKGDLFDWETELAGVYK